jgi:hypothetical protein
MSQHFTFFLLDLSMFFSHERSKEERWLKENKTCTGTLLAGIWQGFAENVWISTQVSRDPGTTPVGGGCLSFPPTHQYLRLEMM